MLEDLWGVGGGPAIGVRYVEAPRGIRAGMPLRVSIHGDQLDGKPFVGGLVEISWQLGDKQYRDVTYTDERGNVDVSRDLDPECEGKPCMRGRSHVQRDTAEPRVHEVHSQVAFSLTRAVPHPRGRGTFPLGRDDLGRHNHRRASARADAV